MKSDARYYGCYVCASKEEEGCVIFQFGIKPLPVVCPCGYAYPEYIQIDAQIEQKLKELSK